MRTIALPAAVAVDRHGSWPGARCVAREIVALCLTVAAATTTGAAGAAGADGADGAGGAGGAGGAASVVITSRFSAEATPASTWRHMTDSANGSTTRAIDAPRGANAVSCAVVPLRVATTGRYTLRHAADTSLSLHSGSFDSSQPLCHVRAADGSGGGHDDAKLVATLQAGAAYFAVAAGELDRGRFDLTISGPDAVTSGALEVPVSDAPLPEPVALALAGVALAGLTVARRRRSA